MPKDIKEILKEGTKDLLTEDTLNQIETVFKESVQKKVDDQVKLQVESAMISIDDKHAGQLKVLLEKIDSDHANKLKKIVEAVQVNNVTKLKKVITKYETTINEEAKKFKDTLVAQISNYLDLYLEKLVPTADIQAAVKSKKAGKLLTEMRKMLGVDLALGQEVIKEGIADGKHKLDAAAHKEQELVTENTQLKVRAEKAEATLLLEQKSVGLPKEKRDYVFKLLSSKTPEFITENFDYTLSMFDKDQETILENLKNEATPVTKNVDRPVAVKSENKDGEQVISESVDPETGRQLAPYMKELRKY